MTPKCTDCKRDQDECNCESTETITRQRDELLLQLRYIIEQTHLGHIHDTASAAIASVKESK